ncbi:calcium-binding protein CML18 [Pyrus ussuriensis x Pyrus communis]|uniref:Calcium-binding protein CML18 n=1 Tax=Pyrus ussuriensis x Pyrus communis TaxID=2448454 RepID=A0A5N5GXX7_9ROSA|nr:calcium-binding protein CML18 [Pyrus ussuriensis x Pyrus communis]
MEEEQMAQLREIFRSFDGNKDSSLAESDHQQLQPLILKLDTNHNVLVEFSEFVALMRRDINGLLQADASCPCYLFDRDGNGYIIPVELAHSMAKLGQPTHDSGVVRHDGRIGFHEFSRAIISAAFLNMNA